jgi:hypothetical protein
MAQITYRTTLICYFISSKGILVTLYWNPIITTKLLPIRGFQKYGVIRILKSMETTTLLILVLLDSNLCAFSEYLNSASVAFVCLCRRLLERVP